MFLLVLSYSTFENLLMVPYINWIIFIVIIILVPTAVRIV